MQVSEKRAPAGLRAASTCTTTFSPVGVGCGALELSATVPGKKAPKPPCVESALHQPSLDWQGWTRSSLAALCCAAAPPPPAHPSIATPSHTATAAIETDPRVATRICSPARHPGREADR